LNNFRTFINISTFLNSLHINILTIRDRAVITGVVGDSVDKTRNGFVKNDL